MSLAATLTAELDHEATLTRRLLERTPASAARWTPHEKSMPLGQLATHVAEIPSWGGAILQLTGFDVAPVDGPPYASPTFESTEALLALFDRNVAEARATLSAMSDEDYAHPWSLLAGGQALFTMPRLAVVRTWVLNHLVHHRGQLSVYLRLQDVPLPGIYGPSADDPGMA
jgi:uncharacterized damage-inducible protein DinB